LNQSDKIIKFSKTHPETENGSSIGLEIDMKYIKNEEWKHLEKAIFDMLLILHYDSKLLSIPPIAVFVGRNEYSGLKRFGIHIEFSGGS
jgi:hypothetical protein